MPDFTTRPATTEALGIGGTDDDARIDALIPQVTAVMLRMMDRPEFFKNGADVTEYPVIASPYATRLFLVRKPGVVVTSIHVSTATPRVYDATTLLTAGTHYLVEADTGIVHRLGSAYWKTPPQAVQVIYDGGYTAAPADLERAAQEIIAAMLQKGKARLYHLTQTRIGEGEVQGIRFDDVPDTARAIIESYREERVR